MNDQKKCFYAFAGGLAMGFFRVGGYLYSIWHFLSKKAYEQKQKLRLFTSARAKSTDLFVYLNVFEIGISIRQPVDHLIIHLHDYDTASPRPDQRQMSHVSSNRTATLTAGSQVVETRNWNWMHTSWLCMENRASWLRDRLISRKITV